MQKEFASELERLDHLVDPVDFTPCGLPSRMLLGRRRLCFWEWLTDQKDSSKLREGLQHLAKDELEKIAHYAVVEGRVNAIVALGAAFDLRRFWQGELEAQIGGGNVMTVYALIEAGARVTSVEKQTAQYRANPVMLGLLGLPFPWDENRKSSEK